MRKFGLACLCVSVATAACSGGAGSSVSPGQCGTVAPPEGQPDAGTSGSASDGGLPPTGGKDAGGGGADAGTRPPPAVDAGASHDGGVLVADAGQVSTDAGGGEDAAVAKPDAGMVATGDAGAGLIFSPYKDTGINMNWNTNVISTNLPGAATGLAADVKAHGGSAVTLAFATGECGSDNWGGIAGATMAAANVPLLVSSGVKYIVSTGGAAGSFTCGTDQGMTTFINAWASPNLIGIDFDIEAGQSQAVIDGLLDRIRAAHTSYPALRFSLTLATLAPSASGSSVATSLGTAAEDSFNVYGDNAMASVKSKLAWDGTAATWPHYLTVNLMTMDYGAASNGICVVNGGICEMGQSAIQAAYNLHDKWGVPYSNIELTPMTGGNDNQAEQFTLADVDAMTSFAIAEGLAGVHYWSYDRDNDCATGSASPTCNTMGAGYAGSYGYLKRFLADGLH